MSTEEVMKRVEADLAVGHRALARQRLKSLVGSFPQDLAVRERLAELYRMDGDYAQAGRWSYLSADVSRTEIIAFERSCGDDPVRMMRALGWRGSEAEASTEVARERLRALRSRAEAEFGLPVAWELPRHEPQGPPTVFDRVVEAGCALLAIGLVLLLLIGVASAVAAGFEVVRTWVS